MAAIIGILIFVLVFALFYGHYRFYRLVERDRQKLFNHLGKTERLVRSDDFRELPALMVNYLKKVGVEGKCKECQLTLKQTGGIRKTPKGKWMVFKADQLMSSNPMGFIWAAKSFPVFVKDKSILGKGQTLVSLFGLFDTIGQSQEINQSALGRYLAELPLYPMAFLNKNISWNALDGHSVRATITKEGTTAEGVFFFDHTGLIQRFESKRYRGENLERFTGEMTAYKTFAGLHVPTKLRAI